MKFKTYIMSSMVGILVVLLAISATVYYVDPYFQYHAPRDDLAYMMNTNDFSYYNAGIAKNFAYDTVITGSSMSRSFLTSYIDEQFTCHSVKLSMAEARGIDFSILLPVVVKNENLKRVIIGLDTFAYNVDKDYTAYEKPMHLYDYNPFNDVLYVANMDGLLKTFDVLQDTKNGAKTTEMDDYQNYAISNTFSREKVVKIYQNSWPVQQTGELDSDALKANVVENLNQNLIPTIKENSDIEFMFYFPPYSIVRWGVIENPDADIECMKMIIEELIIYPNVSIYFYQGEQETITDLEHYMDTIHFDSVIANKIVDYIADEGNKLTIENYEAVINGFSEYVKNYDYEQLLE